VAELEQMANKLSIPLMNEEGKKLKKPDLYKAIWEKVGWIM
jgi:hypothetical protein